MAKESPKIKDEESQEIKKISNNEFEVTETRTHKVDKKLLAGQITELEELLARKIKQSGIERIQKEIERKRALLEDIIATK
jgi:hypothetical protein